MVNYNKSIIYKLCCKNSNIKRVLYWFKQLILLGGNVIINPTVIILIVNINNLNVYQYIRENEGWNNWDMVCIEKFEM